MEMSMVVDRGKSGAERLVETIQELPPMERFGLRRKSRVERLQDEVQELPPAGRIGLIAVATGLLVGVAYLTRKRLFVAAAVVADVVEEAADTVEDSCGGSRRGRPRGRRRLALSRAVAVCGPGTTGRAAGVGPSEQASSRSAQFGSRA